MEVSTKHLLAMSARDLGEKNHNLYFLILDWAQGDEGGLPRDSSRAFAHWLNEVWADWSEDVETTVEDVLKGAVTEWCGGRSF